MKDNVFFPEIHGNFGFGCMRLPMNGPKVDLDQFSRMVDTFIDAGFNYFDTAHGYIFGQSETAIGECLAGRYPREKFLLTNKLTDSFFQSEEEIRPFFEQQLKACGVEYFDFYLMHAQGSRNYPKFKNCRAYETALRLKEEGLIRHVGLSFHDKAEVLDQILSEQPGVEVVQIQFNYLDYDSKSVESGKVYEVCAKHNKPVIVMEPVKGGSLVKLPEEADQVFRKLKGGSNASYAIRFAASFPQMAMVLSGMSDLEQMEDNLRTMKDFKPLSEEEMDAVHEVCEIFSRQERIPCTGCRYCVEENQCPQNINIPGVFSIYDDIRIYSNPGLKFEYKFFIVGDEHGKASDCIQCGMCEDVCPQHLEIRSLLETAAKVLDE